MKRVLVLYPGLVEDRCRLLAPHRWRLRLAGVRLSLADERVTPADARVFGEVVRLPPPQRAAEAWDALARTLERGRYDALVAQSEAGLLLGARAAEAFGLRGPRVDAALATVDKHCSRRLLARAGVPQPAFALARDAAGVRRFASVHGWPVVLKPLASSRQRLVTLVRGPHELDAAVEGLRAALPGARDVRRLVAFARMAELALDGDPEREFLVEAFAAGTPVEVDGVLDGAALRSFGVCEQLPSAARTFFLDGYLLPARLPAATAGGVEATARAAVAALALADTGVSVELRVTAEGPRVIEVNGRLPWDDGLQELFEAVTDRVPAVLALELALGRRIAPVAARRHAALVYANHVGDDEAVLAHGPARREERRLARRGLRLLRFLPDGARLLPGVHPDSHPHLFGVLATDLRSTGRALEHARSAYEGLPCVLRSGAERAVRALVAAGPVRMPARECP